MRTLVLAGLALLTGLALPAALAWPATASAASGDQVWVHTEGSPGGLLDEGRFAVPAPSGGMYLVADYGWAAGQNSDVLLQRYALTPTGDSPVTWSLPWDHPTGHQTDVATGATRDRSGNLIAIVQSSVAGQRDWSVVKRNAGGVYLWAAFFDGGQGDDVPYGVGTDRAGNVYVTGAAQVDAGGAQDLVVVKFRATDGATLWTYRYHGPATPQRGNAGTSIAVDAAGSSYVGGWSHDPAGVPRGILLRLRPNGSLAWMRRVQDRAWVTDTVSRIALRGGAVYAQGDVLSGVTARSPVVARYTIGGSRQWIRGWRGPAGGPYLTTTALTLDGLGRPVLAGYTLQSGNESKAYVASWSAEGRRRWVRTWWIDGPGLRRAKLLAVTADARGRVWAAGSVYAQPQYADALLIRLSPSGRITWTRTYDAGLDESFATVALWGGSSLFAAGWATPGGTQDILAARYVR